MSAKRTSSTEPIKRPAPRKRRASVARELSVASASRANSSPRPSYLLSAEEKREMILAHAAMRRTTDPTQLMTLWAGVAASFVVVAGAWLWAFTPGFARTIKQPDPELQHIVANAADARNAAERMTQESDIRHELDVANARLKALSAQATTQQQVIDGISAGIRPELFQPSQSSSTIPTSSTTTH